MISLVFIIGEGGGREVGSYVDVGYIGKVGLG